MFQPHSVRGLLSRRSAHRVSEDNSELNNHKDPDMQSVIEAKLIIKDIQHQIDDIRKWREHQKMIFNERLASNQAVIDVMKESYEKNAQQQQKRLLEQKQNLLNKLKLHEYTADKQEQRELKGDTNLFEYITNSNLQVQQFKRGTIESEDVYLHAEQTLLNEIEGLGEMMSSKIAEKANNQNKQQVNRALLKQQLDEIDAELREVEQLLRD